MVNDTSVRRMDDIRENGRILGNSLQKISSCAVKGGKLFPENSILISTSATIGEHALITVPHLANQRFTCLALKESYADCFDIKFLFYYCFSLAEWCRKTQRCPVLRLLIWMDSKIFNPSPLPDNPENPLPSSLKSFGFWTNSASLQQSLQQSLPLSLTCVKNSTTIIATSC